MFKYIWKHKLFFYLALVVVGTWADFIHILFYKGQGWLGFGYGLEINFDALIKIFSDLFIIVIDKIKDLF
jgi:hypothetical protein